MSVTKCAFTVVLISLLVVSVHGEDDLSASSKQKIPSINELNEARELVKHLYGEKFTLAESQTQKTFLANELLKVALQTNGEPSAEYVLLNESLRLATEGGKLKIAFQAAERLSERFEKIDHFKLQTKIVSAMSSDSYSISTAKEIANISVERAESAMIENQFQHVDTFIEIGKITAKRVRDSSTQRILGELENDTKELKKQFTNYQGSMERLKNNPDDESANLVVGRYLALRERNWEQAEQNFRIAMQDDLQDLVAREFAASTDIAERLELADDWWKFSLSESGASKWQAQAVAITHYRKVVSELTGFTEKRVSGRLKQFPEQRVRRLIRQASSDSSGKTFNAQLTALTNSVGMELVPIPAGEFMMGSQRNESLAKGNEFPQHRVEISKAFLMGAFEVSNKEYFSVLGQSVPRRSSWQVPVSGLSWQDAVLFCKMLSGLPEEKKAGRVYRLPTEAEWEYACRASSNDQFFWGNSFGLRDEYVQTAWPALLRGVKKPNTWGLYDMQGGLTEWCNDWYSPTYYQSSPKVDPKGPITGSTRVHRGVPGRRPDVATNRSAFRANCPPNQRNPTLGIRVVCEVKQ